MVRGRSCPGSATPGRPRLDLSPAAGGPAPHPRHSLPASRNHDQHISTCVSRAVSKAAGVTDLQELHRRASGWLPSTGAYFENRNPANPDDLIGRFPDSDQRDVDAAVRSAKRGFALWSRTPAPARGDVLRRVGDLLVERKDAIADAMTREMGKVLAETRGDVQEGIDTAYYAATEGRRLFGHVVPSELRSKWAMSYRRPIGVVGLITPFNFPHGHPDLEDVSRAALRELGDHQAVRGRAPHGAPAGGDPARGGPAARGHPAGARPGRDGGQGAGRASRGPGHLLHRVDRDRRDHRRDLRPDAQAALAGDGRQERHDRDGRRRSGPGARRRALGRLRHHRAALHRHQPSDPASQGARPVSPAGWRMRPRR